MVNETWYYLGANTLVDDEMAGTRAVEEVLLRGGGELFDLLTHTKSARVRNVENDPEAAIPAGWRSLVRHSACLPLGPILPLLWRLEA
jgi:hypothetical protein